MEFTAQQIAEMLGGTVHGNPDSIVDDLSTIEAGKPRSLTFLANPAYTEYIYSTKASVSIVSKEFEPEKALPSALTLVKVADPRLAFTKLMEQYAQMMRRSAGTHPTATIHETSTVHPSAHIGAFVVVEEHCTVGEGVVIRAHGFVGKASKIGDGSELHERVHIGERTLIGKHCVLQPGAIIGGDGFGFAPNQENEYQKVVHLGNVVLEDRVEIGANTTIDRGTLGSTIIRKGVKLDNLIQVAHNVEIGENTVIAAQTGIAGSTKIGKNCMIGGQVGIVGHISIADGVKIAAQSGVGSSILEEGQIVQGSPAIPIGDFKRSYVHFRKLEEMSNALKELSSEAPKKTKHG